MRVIYTKFRLSRICAVCASLSVFLGDLLQNELRSHRVAFHYAKRAFKRVYRDAVAAVKAVNTHGVVQVVSRKVKKIDPKRIFATVKPLFKAPLTDGVAAKHYQKLARYLAVVVVLRRNFPAFT